MFPRSVSTTRRIHVHVRTLRDGVPLRHFFELHGHVRVHVLTHEPMSVCSFEHNFPLLRLMRRVSTSCINCET